MEELQEEGEDLSTLLIMFEGKEYYLDTSDGDNDVYDTSYEIVGRWDGEKIIFNDVEKQRMPKNRIKLNIKLMKGKDVLISLMKIIEPIMILHPEKFCNINIFADENDPDKISCYTEKDYNLEELKEFVDDMLNKFSGWDMFD